MRHVSIDQKNARNDHDMTSILVLRRTKETAIKDIYTFFFFFFFLSMIKFFHLYMIRTNVLYNQTKNNCTFVFERRKKKTSLVYA